MNKNRFVRKHVVILGNHKALLPRGKSWFLTQTHVLTVFLQAVDANNSRPDQRHCSSSAPLMGNTQQLILNCARQSKLEPVTERLL